MNLVIYGADGLGREIYDLAERINEKEGKWSEIILIDDFAQEGNYGEAKKLHFDTLLVQYDMADLEAVAAVGEPSSRAKLYQKLKDAGIALAVLIDPTALVSPFAMVEQGAIVCEFSSIHAGVRLEEGCLIQPYVVVGHDICVGRYSVLSAGCQVGGHTIIGEESYVALNASVRDKLAVGNRSIIGMGAVVHKDVPDDVVVVGNPARATKGNEAHRVF